MRFQPKVLMQSFLQLSVPIATCLGIAMLGGCASTLNLPQKPTFESQGNQDQSDFCRDKHPIIHNIGNSGALTFYKNGTSLENQEIHIPINGRDLYASCVNVVVHVTSVVPVMTGDYGLKGFEEVPGENADTGEVVLNTSLVDRLNSNDRITVEVVVSERNPFHNTDESKRIVTIATRTFTVYDVNDYRTNVLANQVPLQDIRTFPLPETEVAALFGAVIAQDFYVVKLSIMNRESEAKLVSTGMITASGRAIVEPWQARDKTWPWEKVDKKWQSFTVPVTVVPSSLQQTYSILDGEEVNQPRPFIFRTLEFIGALATGVTATFSPSLIVSKSIGLYTGVGIPASAKFVPDRWPDYKKNLVNYAAPDLLKVPANASADHKLLFFSKRDIELLIMDQTLFGEVAKIDKTSADWEVIAHTPQSPDVRVISIAFDNLDVRFEKVVEANPSKLSPPTNVSAEMSGANIEVKFAAPKGDTTQISGYTATATNEKAAKGEKPLSKTGTDPAKPIDIPGCTSGAVYDVAVVANSKAGSGSDSDPAKYDKPVTCSAPPATRVGPPTNVSAEMRGANIEVKFAAPKGDTTQISGYTATATNEKAAKGEKPLSKTGTDPAKPIDIPGCTSGAVYDVAVVANSKTGSGSDSDPAKYDKPVTCGAPPATRVGPPTNVSAEMSGVNIEVKFTAPKGDTTQISGYTATATNEKAAKGEKPLSKTGTDPAKPIDIPGCTSGAVYDVAVVANSKTGSGSDSAPVKAARAVACSTK
jgi:hypothetical protein